MSPIGCGDNGPLSDPGPPSMKTRHPAPRRILDKHHLIRLKNSGFKIVDDDCV